MCLANFVLINLTLYNSVMEITAATKIRELSSGQIYHLAHILEHDWKKLLSVIRYDPSNLGDHRPRFNMDDVRAIESAGRQSIHLSCSDIFLQEWSTCSSNGKTPTIQLLRQYLEKAELKRAAAYVVIDLLGEPYTLQEPEEGWLPSTEFHVPSADAPTKILEIPYHVLQYLTNGFDKSFEIGSGAFGSVYRSDISGQAVAIKKFGNCENEREHFEQERIALLSELFHENLLPPFAISQDEEPCSVYKLMPNGSLEDRLKLKNPDLPPLTWKKRVSIAMDICEGLKYLHTRPKPIVHRDIKPANILLDEIDNAKIGDFGLIRIKNDSKTTNTSIIRGTNAYMANEALRGTISLKMDIFSFGVILLQLLTGLPVSGGSQSGHLKDNLEDKINPEEGIMPHLDKTAGQWDMSIANELNDLAWKCLKDLIERPDTAHVHTELKKLYLMVK